MSSRFDINIVEDDVNLDAIAPEWEALNSKVGAAGFFTQHRVIKANWARYRNDRGTRLHVFIVRENNAMVFAAPMVRQVGLSGTHKLVWLDSKTPIYDDVLMDPRVDVDGISALFAGHIRSSWTRRALKVGFIRDDSALWRILRSADMAMEERTIALWLDVSRHGSWDEYLASISANSRQKIRNFQRRLQRAGAETVAIVTDVEEREAEIANIFLRRRQWVTLQPDLDDWILPQETEHWFQDITRQADGRNRTHVLRMRSSEAWIASMLCFERDGTLFTTKIAHNPAWEKFSPGWVLVHHAIRLAIERKLERVDFMIGHSEWKERISDHSSKIYKCRLDLLPWRRRQRARSQA